MRENRQFPFLGVAALVLAAAPASRAQIVRTMRVGHPTMITVMEGSVTGSLEVIDEHSKSMGDIKKFGDQVVIEKPGTYSLRFFLHDETKEAKMLLSLFVDDRPAGEELGSIGVFRIRAFNKSLEVARIGNINGPGGKAAVDNITFSNKADQPLFTIR